MRYVYRFAAVAVTALALAACGNTGDAVGPSDPPPAASAPPTALSLAGPTWRLVSIEGRQALPGVSVTAAFGEDERVTGSAGCNRYFGRAALAGSQLEVGLLGSTRMFCGADGVMAQEDSYLAALQTAKASRIEGSELRLGPTPGAVTLVFKAE